MARTESDINIRSLPKEIGPGDFAQTRRLGRFDECQLIGSGSAGIVFSAVTEKRPVALKLGRSSDKRAVAHYERSADMQRRVAEHADSVPDIYETTTVEIAGKEFPLIVMQRVEGPPLTEAIAVNRTMGPKTLAERLGPVAQAIDAGNGVGVVHRDITTGNVVGRSLIDYDIACDTGEIADTSRIVGTRGYFAPEQVTDGGIITGRTDLYQLGLLILYGLTGVHPVGNGGDYDFAIESGELVAHIQTQISTTLFRSDLVPVLSQALSKNPDDRYSTAAELLTDLAADHEPTVIVDMHTGGFPMARA